MQVIRLSAHQSQRYILIRWHFKTRKNSSKTPVNGKLLNAIQSQQSTTAGLRDNWSLLLDPGAPLSAIESNKSKLSLTDIGRCMLNG